MVSARRSVVSGLVLFVVPRASSPAQRSIGGGTIVRGPTAQRSVVSEVVLFVQRASSAAQRRIGGGCAEGEQRSAAYYRGGEKAFPGQERSVVSLK